MGTPSGGVDGAEVPAILSEPELGWLLEAFGESLRAVARHNPRVQLVS